MKWVLSLATLCILFVAGLLAPERPKMSRVATVSVETLPVPEGAEPEDAAASFASYWELPETWRRERYESPISEAEAVEIALKRGEEIRAERKAGNEPRLRSEDADLVAATVAVPESADTGAEQQPSPALWRVTADRVNLRGGPGTDNPVVGTADRGEALEPVSGLGSDWVEVRLSSGRTAWIYAKFLNRTDG